MPDARPEPNVTEEDVRRARGFMQGRCEHEPDDSAVCESCLAAEFAAVREAAEQRQHPDTSSARGPVAVVRVPDAAELAAAEQRGWEQGIEQALHAFISVTVALNAEQMRERRDRLDEVRALKREGSDG